MTRGVVRLQSVAGSRGAKLIWLLEGVEPSEDDFSGEPLADTLANTGVRAIGGIAFWAWRCTDCKVISFTYPQGTA